MMNHGKEVRTNQGAMTMNTEQVKVLGADMELASALLLALLMYSE
jgi:hypothetical protein